MERIEPLLRRVRAGLEAMRLGREVQLIVTGTIGGKRFRLGGSDDEGLVYNCRRREDLNLLPGVVLPAQPRVIVASP